MKAIKITSVAWLPQLAEHIEKLCKRINVPGIHGPNYYAFIAQGIQFGGNFREFWTIWDEDKPIALAMWSVLGLPHIGKVYCDCMYSWTKDRQPVDMLVDEFIGFAERHRAIWYSADFVSKATVRLFTNRMEAKGFVGGPSGRINLCGRRKK